MKKQIKKVRFYLTFWYHGNTVQPIIMHLMVTEFQQISIQFPSKFIEKKHFPGYNWTAVFLSPSHVPLINLFFIKMHQIRSFLLIIFLYSDSIRIFLGIVRRPLYSSKYDKISDSKLRILTFFTPMQPTEHSSNEEVWKFWKS